MPSTKASLKAMAQDAKNKKKSATSKKTAKPAPATSFKSTEFIQESDEEDEEGTKSDNESDSNDDSLPANPADGTRKTNGKLPAPSGSSSSSDNESSSSSDESSEEGEEEESASRAVVEPEPAKQRPRESSARTVAFDKPPPYKPPTGFETASIRDKSTASDMLRKSNLKDKQLWYFTAPASIPISTIEQMSLVDVEAGKTVLDHNGGEYGFVQDSTGDKSYTKIMVPSSSEDAYHTASKPIDRVLHLQQIVKLPDINDAGASLPSSSRATVPTEKPVRQQPQGLKMRFRPIGFGKGKLGKIGSSSSDGSASDEEMDDAPTVFHRPALEGLDEEMEDAPPTSTKSKHKKKHESAEPTSSPLKRKYDGDQSSKKSSSQQINTLDDRALKKLKKKQKESRKSTVDSPSASTESKQPTTPHSHKAKHATLTTSHLESSPILPSYSRLSEVKPSQEPKSSPSKHHKKRPRDSEKTPSKKDDLSLHELTKATDPSLTGEERRKKIKKLKHEGPK